MSRRQRTTNRQLCSMQVLEEARKRINNGESIRGVARSFNMNEATLRKRLKKDVPVKSLGRYTLTFTPEMEEELCSYIKKIDNMYYGLTCKGLRELAYQFAEANELETRFNKEKRIAGTEWLRGFLKRHPTISLRQPTSTSIARAIGFNKPQCDRFFENLSQLLKKYNFSADSIYNMDETGISTVPNKPPKVLSTKGKRCVNKISSAERGINVTLVCAMSASGNFIPPAFIFPRKRMKPELLDGAPICSLGMVSDSSYMNSELFVDRLSHFKNYARSTHNHPILLILDNHGSHISLKAINFFRENNIHVLTLPTHSSHKTQPLDRCFFNSLKKFYASECKIWMRNHPRRAITCYQIASILMPAYLKSATPRNAIEGFKVTGIYPYNPYIFTEDFLSSVVTNRPLSHNLKNESIQTNIINHSSTSTTENSAPLKSVFQVAPLPTAQSSQETMTTRRKRKSDIISSSPFKKQLEEEIKNSSQNLKTNRRKRKYDKISNSPINKPAEEEIKSKLRKPNHTKRKQKEQRFKKMYGSALDANKHTKSRLLLTGFNVVSANCGGTKSAQII
ncbi:uncharacterized protein [Prorops nasuta]|uniref:uncharacterized protein n=1 Tax=Prorops nasuta TaxID=863751 RepID=UPI0034CD7828